MRMLAIAPEVPYPPHSGGKSRAFNLLSRLGKRAELSLVCLSHSAEEEEATDYLRSLFTVRTVPWEMPAGYRAMHESAWPMSSLHYVRSLLFDPLPFLASYFRSPAMQAAVDEALPESYDAVFVVTSMMGQFVRESVRRKAIVDLWNVETLVQQRQAQRASSKERLGHTLEYRKMRRFEGDQFKTVGLCVAVSELEKQAVLRIEPSARVAVVDNGVDVDYFTPQHAAARPDSLIYTGTMKYKPNEEAILYFCREILPAVRAAIPAVTLKIVGTSPPGNIRALASECVQVTGWVEDVRPHLAAASLVIVPLLSGGGSRLKITEALAMGKAVVSTSMGAEGLELHHGRHLLIANDPADFANAVIQLLGNPQRRESLGDEGRRKVIERYGWDLLATRLYDACLELTERLSR